MLNSQSAVSSHFHIVFAETIIKIMNIVKLEIWSRELGISARVLEARYGISVIAKFYI